MHVQVDAAVLQYQNQMLLQQIDKQKHELQDLEANIKELKAKQGSYDDMLIAVNRLWNQVIMNLLFGIFSIHGLIFICQQLVFSDGVSFLLFS